MSETQENNKFNFVYDNKPVFVGLSNYVEALKTPAFLKALSNTIRFTLWYIPLVFILGFLIGYIVTIPNLFSSPVTPIPLLTSCLMRRERDR